MSGAEEISPGRHFHLWAPRPPRAVPSRPWPRCWRTGEKGTFSEGQTCATQCTTVREGICMVFVTDSLSVTQPARGWAGQQGGQVSSHRGLCSAAFQLCPVVRFWFYLISQRSSFLRSELCHWPECCSLAKTIAGAAPPPLVFSPSQPPERFF